VVFWYRLHSGLETQAMVAGCEAATRPVCAEPKPAPESRPWVAGFESPGDSCKQLQGRRLVPDYGMAAFRPVGRSSLPITEM
jgi:hypothetical protein